MKKKYIAPVLEISEIQTPAVVCASLTYSDDTTDVVQSPDVWIIWANEQ